jgi:hypothetical protein
MLFEAMIVITRGNKGTQEQPKMHEELPVRPVSSIHTAERASLLRPKEVWHQIKIKDSKEE